MNDTARPHSPNPLEDTVPHDGPVGLQARYVFRGGDRPLDGYTIKRSIGRGGFGEVYYALSDAGREVALKLITRNIEIERRGVTQCMNLKCPYLVTVFDIKANDAGENFVIMEFVAGPSLAQILSHRSGPMPTHEVMHWWRGIVEGVAYLHDHGIVHRDLKPANLFMEDNTVKIGDYGLSKHMTESQRGGHSDSIGTCHYMAPEISRGRYDRTIDIYALGVILHEMLTGRVPFDGQSVGEVLMKHLTDRPDLSRVSEPFRTLIGRCLAKDPAQRPRHARELLCVLDGQMPAAAGACDDGEVVRIGMEEPPFYIGPDTLPPRQGRRGAWRPALRMPNKPIVTPRNKPRRPQPLAAVPVARPVVATVPVAVEPPPLPMVAPPLAMMAPPLPSARLRVAELAGSLVGAALLCAPLGALAAFLMEVDIFGHPERAANLVGVPLFGAWLWLIAAKFREGATRARRPGMLRRMARGLPLGLGVGVLAEVASQWTHFRSDDSMFEALVAADALPGGAMGPLATLGFFAASFALLGLWDLAGRGRSSRFRLGPMLLIGAMTLGLGLVWPYPQPWGAATMVMIAAVVQLASPWDSASAAFARAQRRGLATVAA